MKIVIDISEYDYEMACRWPDALIAVYAHAIKNGTPLPDDAEILTKEAYSDLCSRAADVPDFESEEYVNERLNNYNKLLKSGMLDCIIEKSQESEDK